MPNWSYNSIEVKGKKADVLEFGAALLGRRKEILNLREVLLEKGVDFEFRGEINNRTFVAVKDHKILSMADYEPIYNEAYKEALERVQKAEPIGEEYITFNTIVPMPDVCLVDKQNVLELDGSRGDVHGLDGWYGWSVANWGTKWDMCDTDISSFREAIKEVEELDDDIKDTSFYVSFNTAWAAPVPFVVAASRKFPKVEILLSAQEESGAFFFEETYLGGETIKTFEVDNEFEWMLHTECDVDHIFDSITWGYDTDRLEDMINGDADHTIEEMTKLLSEAITHDDLKEVTLKCFTPGEHHDEDTAKILNQVKDAFSKAFDELEEKKDDGKNEEVTR